MSNTNIRFNIGTQYMSAGKCPHICKVVDIHRTFDANNDLVKVRYVATHNFMGQIITDSDVVDATIARGKEALESKVKALYSARDKVSNKLQALDVSFFTKHTPNH